MGFWFNPWIQPVRTGALVGHAPGTHRGGTIGPCPLPQDSARKVREWQSIFRNATFALPRKNFCWHPCKSDVLKVIQAKFTYLLRMYNEKEVFTSKLIEIISNSRFFIQICHILSTNLHFSNINQILSLGNCLTFLGVAVLILWDIITKFCRIDLFHFKH